MTFALASLRRGWQQTIKLLWIPFLLHPCPDINMLETGQGRHDRHSLLTVLGARQASTFLLCGAEDREQPWREVRGPTQQKWLHTLVNV